MSTYRERAMRIVDRVLPKLPISHGFYDPDAFMAAAIRNAERERLYWRTFARLRAKAEGGRPFIAIPQGSAAMIGGAMWQVAKELEAAA